MVNLSREALTNLLNTTFANNRENIEKQVRRRFGSGNAAAMIAYVAERASVASYIYYLEKLETGDATDFESCRTEEEALNLLSMTARSRALDLIRRKARSNIVHGVLDAPRNSDEDSGSSSDWFQAKDIPHDEDSVMGELRIHRACDSLSELSDDDWAFMEKLVGTQLDGDYARPPYKAVAKELGEPPHVVEYRWKKLKEKITLLVGDNLERQPGKKQQG